MIPQTFDRSVDSCDSGERAGFGISRGDEAHLMTVLRDTLYSDKVLAVLREYGANAWDAHREAGKGDVPIRVRLPTLEDQTLSIRDFGRGLSKREVFELFTQYGASTKRADSGQVGMLGIGSKSGFAYADSFTVVSRCEGKCRTYVCTLDVSERGEVRLLDEFDSDDTGLEIQVAVRREDLGEFGSKAENLFKYFDPLPDICAKLPDVSWTPKPYGRWTAVMGCVPYPIDLSQLKLPHYARNVGCALRFEIGALHIAASREQLKYSEKTRGALEAAICAAIDGFVLELIRSVESLSPWTQKLALSKYGGLDLPLIPRVNGKYSISGSFTLKVGRKVRETIELDDAARIVLRDDRRGLKGFALSATDYVVYGYDHRPPEEAAVAAAVRAAGIEGIPIVKTSELSWTRPERSPRRGANPNARRSMFRLCTYEFKRPLSSNWEAVERAPQPEDLYVHLDRFDTNYHQIHECRDLLSAFGLEMPEVYGYKKVRVGVELGQWMTVLAEVLAGQPGAREDVERLRWVAEIGEVDESDVAKVAATLGAEHPLSQLLVRAAKPHRYTDRAVCWLSQRLPDDPASRKAVVAAALGKYPLLKTYGLRSLVDKHSIQWLEYIRMTDTCDSRRRKIKSR